jgi:hypothetical protein
MTLKQQDLNDLLEQWTKNLEEMRSNTPALSDKCDHEFKEYIGFTERYFYCKYCDAKSRDGIWIDG